MQRRKRLEKDDELSKWLAKKIAAIKPDPFRRYLKKGPEMDIPEFLRRTRGDIAIVILGNNKETLGDWVYCWKISANDAYQALRGYRFNGVPATKTVDGTLCVFEVLDRTGQWDLPMLELFTIASLLPKSAILHYRRRKRK